MSHADEDVLRFIAASFPSVWALELLLMLKRERRQWGDDELVAVLRASDVVVSKALDALVAAGLASIEREGAIYCPVNSETEQLVERVEQLYGARPNAVRRVIVVSDRSGATAFADAFRLRKNNDD